MEPNYSKLLNIAVLDEQEIVRYGMYKRFSTERDFIIVGAYRCIPDFLQALRYKHIDVVILDHMFETGDALELIRNLKNEYPALRILISSVGEHPAVVELLISLGAHDYICKSAMLDDYVLAIRALADGDRYIDKSAGIVPLAEYGHGSEHDLQEGELLGSNLLTAREKEVLRLCMRGMSVTQISLEFERSLKTISSQKLSAYRKLGLSSDLDLFRALSSSIAR